MNCEWREKTGMYVDGELEPAAQEAFTSHLESCSGCATSVLERQELKKAIRIAGKRFPAPPDLYATVHKRLHPERAPRRWAWVFASAALVFLIAVSVAFFPRTKQDPTIAGLVDQHINTLASANPVDVISTSRHVVKPWFQGRLPFTFNLPELQGSPYTLIGGRVAYVQQLPGAELLYQVGQHKITVFIFKASGGASDVNNRSATFAVKSWREGALQFYMITDASDYESGRLLTMLQDVNR